MQTHGYSVNPEVTDVPETFRPPDSEPDVSAVVVDGGSYRFPPSSPPAIFYPLSAYEQASE